MQRVESELLCSPLGLASFIACEHLTQLELAVALGKGTRPAFENAYADLIEGKGGLAAPGPDGLPDGGIGLWSGP